MARSAAVRAPSRNAQEIRERFRPRLVPNAPPLGVIAESEIELLGRRAVLVLERVAHGQLRAAVAVREGSSFASVWSLGREFAYEAHGLARAYLLACGAQPTAEGAWGSCWTVDATEAP